MVKRALTAWLIASLCVMVAPALAQPSADGLAQAAADAYQQGDMRQAIELYEQAIAAGMDAPELWHNLGNAYYEIGDLGRALLAYRRAYRDLPRNPSVNLNITLVRALRVDVQTDDTALIDVIAVSTEGILSVPELIAIALALWWSWFALLSAALARPVWRAALRPFLLGVGIATAIACVLTFGRLYADTYRPLAVVVVSDARVTTGPGQEYPFLFLLYSAAELRVLESRGGWARFTLPDGRQGWIAEQDIERV